MSLLKYRHKCLICGETCCSCNGIPYTNLAIIVAGCRKGKSILIDNQEDFSDITNRRISIISDED